MCEMLPRWDGNDVTLKTKMTVMMTMLRIFMSVPICFKRHLVLKIHVFTIVPTSVNVFGRRPFCHGSCDVAEH